MNVQAGCIVVVTILSLVVAGSSALADGKAKGRGSKPPGWDQGNKKGWDSNVPPGIDKKGGGMPNGLDKKGQQQWLDDRGSQWKYDGNKGSQNGNRSGLTNDNESERYHGNRKEWKENSGSTGQKRKGGKYGAEKE